MKKIFMFLAVIWTIGCMIFLGYEFITNTQEIMDFVIHDWTWKIGCIIGILLARKVKLYKL